MAGGLLASAVGATVLNRSPGARRAGTLRGASLPLTSRALQLEMSQTRPVVAFIEHVVELTPAAGEAKKIYGPVSIQHSL